MKITGDVNYNKDLDKFQEFKLHAPLSTCLRITNRCNFSCPHCIANGSNNKNIDLSQSNIKKFLKKLSSAGVIRVDITGGEPFLRKDLNDILLFAHQCNLATVVTTNGSIMTKDNIKALKESKTFANVSIDGPEKINNLLRHPNSFIQACNTVKLLHKNKIPVRINCTLQKRNYQYIEYMYNFSKELGACSLYFIVVSAQGRAEHIKDEICLSPDQEKGLREKVSELKKANDLDLKILDYKYFESACPLIEEAGNFVSQKFDQNKTKIVGNVLKEDISELWCKDDSFNHILHILFYFQYFHDENAIDK